MKIDKNKISRSGKNKDICKKVDTSLLPFIDEEFCLKDQHIQNQVETMKNLNQYLPAKTILPHDNSYTPADMLYLELNLADSYSYTKINAHTWRIVNYCKNNRLIIAWVRVDQLHRLVSLPDIVFIRPVMPPTMR